MTELLTPAWQGLNIDADKPVQGCALYAEFVNTSGYVYQNLLIPDGVAESGQLQTIVMLSRRLHTLAPKKQWGWSYTNGVRISTDDPALLENHYEARLARIEYIFQRILLSSSTLNGKPFFVEVSKKDLEDIKKRKTPTKVLYRVGQTRTALGYPELFKKGE